jgi:hypothetical protein
LETIIGIMDEENRGTKNTVNEHKCVFGMHELKNIHIRNIRVKKMSFALKNRLINR